MTHPLRTARLAAGYTSIAQLAAASGLAEGTIGRIERGDTTFKVHEDTALALAATLARQLRDLFRIEELSHLGRRPKTGVPCTLSVRVAEVRCERCFMMTPCGKPCIHC